jgi:hypothetical protein
VKAGSGSCADGEGAGDGQRCWAEFSDAAREGGRRSRPSRHAAKKPWVLGAQGRPRNNKITCKGPPPLSTWGVMSTRGSAMRPLWLASITLRGDKSAGGARAVQCVFTVATPTPRASNSCGSQRPAGASALQATPVHARLQPQGSRQTQGLGAPPPRAAPRSPPVPWARFAAAPPVARYDRASRVVDLHQHVHAVEAGAHVQHAADLRVLRRGGGAAEGLFQATGRLRRRGGGGRAGAGVRRTAWQVWGFRILSPESSSCDPVLGRSASPALTTPLDAVAFQRQWGDPAAPHLHAADAHGRAHADAAGKWELKHALVGLRLAHGDALGPQHQRDRGAGPCRQEQADAALQDRGAAHAKVAEGPGLGERVVGWVLTLQGARGERTRCEQWVWGLLLLRGPRRAAVPEHIDCCGEKGRNQKPPAHL